MNDSFSSLGHVVPVKLHEAILPTGVVVCLKGSSHGEEKRMGLGFRGPGSACVSASDYLQSVANVASLLRASGYSSEK